MTRADWEAATPKCPKGQVANIPGAMCGALLRWESAGDDDEVFGGVWVCPAHGMQFTGREAARRAGFVEMWFAGAA